MTTTITRVENPAGAHPAAVYGQDEDGNYYTRHNTEWWPENQATRIAREVRANGGHYEIGVTNEWRKGENWMMRQGRKVA